MKAATKLGLFGVGLAAVLAGGLALGVVVGPLDSGGAAQEHAMAEALPVGGLLVSQDGYTLVPERRQLDPGPFAFTITGPDGAPVQDYDLLHERELHLIIASRDLQQFAHLHPTRDDDGRWTVEAPPMPGGAYRAYADFQPTDAAPYTLGVDLTAPGPVGTAALAPVTTATVDGYTVDLVAEDDTVTLTVRQGDRILTTEPYLGAAGHLVALRDGDLAYLHVHPLDDEPDGPVRFAVEYPSAGIYALFFDFQIDGVVRTARFVLQADDADHGGH